MINGSIKKYFMCYFIWSFILSFLVVILFGYCFVLLMKKKENYTELWKKVGMLELKTQKLEKRINSDN